MVRERNMRKVLVLLYAKPFFYRTNISQRKTALFQFWEMFYFNSPLSSPYGKRYIDGLQLLREDNFIKFSIEKFKISIMKKTHM